MSVIREPSNRSLDTRATEDSGGDDKQPFIEPKLTFVSPKLEKHGSLDVVTQQGFFGTFTPGS